jgi:hypothetical protein
VTWDPQLALSEHALAVLTDPASTSADRARAREHLAGARGRYQLDNLTVEEQERLLDLLDRASGIVGGEILDDSPTARRARAIQAVARGEELLRWERDRLAELAGTGD